MDNLNTSLPTTIGDGSNTILYDNIKKTSDLHRIGFSDNEFRNRALKYTLVTATEKGYEVLDHEIANTLESERKGEIVYRTVAPFGNLFEKRAKKKELLYGENVMIEGKKFHIPGVMEVNPKLGIKLKDLADSYIRTIIGMIGEYESYVKGKSQEKGSKDLKLHYANLREGYKNSLNREKDELLKIAQMKGIDDWGHKFLIRNMEYTLSDGLLIGRHKLCQIPIENKPDSEVSGLQWIIIFDEDNPLNKERKIRYNNLGFNLGNIIRLKGKDKDNLETHFNQDDDCVDCLIDLNDRSHQLSIVLFGKAIPIVGNGDKDERFIQALVSKAVKRSQYYLALELPSSSF